MQGRKEKQETSGKEAANYLLTVCYLYNYGVVHCSLVYDLVRDFVKNFARTRRQSNKNENENISDIIEHQGC